MKSWLVEAIERLDFGVHALLRGTNGDLVIDAILAPALALGLAHRGGDLDNRAQMSVLALQRDDLIFGVRLPGSAHAARLRPRWRAKAMPLIAK